MGRKIPAKKHRGVKDPLAQQAKRLQSLKGKINAPPKDPDEQPVPRSLMRLFGLKDPNKTDVAKKKKNSKPKKTPQGKDVKVNHSGNNPISQLRKLPGESGRGFSLRINSAIKALHSPDEDLDYPHDLEAEDYKGQRMEEQRERRAKKRRRAEKAARRNGEGEEKEQHLTRTQKFALKKQAKKTKALEVRQEKAELVYERVSFGDVSHAPPTLHVTSRGGAARPGRRDLLLNKLLAGDAARREAVAAYRALKAAGHKRQ